MIALHNQWWTFYLNHSVRLRARYTPSLLNWSSHMTEYSDCPPCCLLVSLLSNPLQIATCQLAQLRGFSLLKSMLIILKDSRKSAPIRWKYKWGIQFKSERKFSVTSCWAPQNSHAELHIHTGEMIGLPWFWKIKKDKRQLRHLGNAWIYLVFSNKSISILQMENGQIKWKTEYLSKASPKRKLSIGKSWDAFNKHHRLHKQLQCSMSYIIQLSSTLMEG